MEVIVFVFFSCLVVICASYNIAPPKRQCGQNEELSCVHECPPEKTCKTRGIEFDCIAPIKKCEDKCVCKPGYYRNAIGDCITDEECDMCKGSNEFFSCGSACDNRCSEINTQNRTRCPIFNIVCNRKCYCEDGFARDDKEQCIPVKDCPKSHKCDINEEYKECKSTCPPETCMSLYAKFKCAEDPECIPRCVCKPGYLRKEKKSPCVPMCECPGIENSPMSANGTL